MSVTVPRKVVLAGPRSFCAGVERAIEIVERVVEQRSGAPVFVRKQIVHNAHVVADLEGRGVVFVDELDQIPEPPPQGAVVVLSAHGVAPAVRAEAARRGLEVVDATCPLVAKVHGEARRLIRNGVQVVLVGHAGHEEVDGTLGHAPPDAIKLVQSAQDVGAVDIADGGRVAYLTQTTLAVDETSEIVDGLRARYPNLVGPPSDDICYATTNRQQAVAAIAAEADLVLVVGSANSSNSVRLVEVARRAGAQAHLIEDVTEIRPEWLADAASIGLTAGASAPQHLVNEVVEFLRAQGPVTVTERTVTTETIRFGLPAQVR
ncbi:4-hydroxy-3-methylbut-2-enyl diphosphate reductase [Lentzea albida]|uniref:4-hydroxy-3-methylbut-2-enyl diphosphate reductase n=1 Tax=Lentzea albida TaxID=65499 RepID=A0A1H9X1Y1_9PSEU|nr:4-hydroxy-3-methylbut-2-enyl diphosphate reductase [Lentzea albida]SES40115.1 4-hydroxy-3-methylbut-2-enyl diphosphate reductase [Lentzea albida]